MRAILLSAMLALSPLSATASSDAIGIALAAIGAQDFELAAQARSQIEDDIGRDVVTWAQLRARQGSFAEYVDFLERNPDWPGLPFLRARGERNIPEGAEPATVIAYFAPQPPETGTGSLRLAEALRARGDADAAHAEIIRAWTTMTLTTSQFETMLAEYGPVLADHHIARLDNLLWQGEQDRARQMENFVPENWRALAEARVALRERRPGVDTLIEAVPDALQSDPGLAYERFLWRVRSGFWDTASDLMLATSTSAEALGRPSVWGSRRASLARDVLREGEFARAYALASSHFIDPDDDYLNYSDLEWISGYAALRMGNADQAITHFTNFRNVVFSPISVGRAGYWLGRAHEAAGNADEAAEAYALGAQFQSSFYGQLAAERGGLPTDPHFLGNEMFGDWRTASFMGSSVLRAALVLYEAGQTGLAERFMTHLTESLSRQEAGQLADLAFDLGDPHIALMIAKRAAQQGYEIMRAYYPVTDLAQAQLPSPASLNLSIARRESEFDPDVISSAGAVGLMQVMPGTGRGQAGRLGIEFSEARLLSDPAYNAVLGSGYLAYLAEEFGSNPVLLAAAYNAGPSRARTWIERFGDPRSESVDVIDWIEAIPFTETRNYIMRVTESLAIYDAQLTGELAPPALTERLKMR
ncbi:lytic transglycosylase domain-containing protein [Rhodophyticola porphyridii]|uniref:Lytic transglycosylase domain-containing protein n=1 Tax=Rhodophyticola porphyridii TaxID=1852017 RepID=A0A3L9Y558_9RHOB|nr:lytic transglycosylase domain-containing protein [Rhodophyticola porphyridii]RMA42585.1 lytic transglycosylase domain-containing protein [Rhodophyticola porphyridii]